MFRTFPLLCLLFLTAVRSENCDQDAGATLYCRGERALRNVLRNLNRSDHPLVVVRGLEIVPLQNNSIADKEPDQEQGLLDTLSFYLRTHEINVKLADLLEDEAQVSEARKKDKGQEMLLAMALMFGKMMAVMGLGGIAGIGHEGPGRVLGGSDDGRDAGSEDGSPAWRRVQSQHIVCDRRGTSSQTEAPLVRPTTLGLQRLGLRH
ncbi:GM10866 [Drosophila sechellia]|uniref:GM10866 n=1 Tax=Drosophila sechellia TaxID=7238 RepID=B4I4C5_DROSE|nr:GM10866 [Drosophila sechellia]